MNIICFVRKMLQMICGEERKVSGEIEKTFDWKKKRERK